MISSGSDGKPDVVVVDGRLSMNDRTSLSIEELSCDCNCSVPLPPFEFESLNSKVEGTVVVGASAWRSRFEVTKEFQTSASNAPSE